MNDETQQAALTRFDFTSGLQRGSHLLLYSRSLVHRSDAYLETVPLARVTAINVGFHRNTRQMGWGIALVIVALVLLGVAGPLGNGAQAAQEALTSGQNVARALQSLFRLIEVVAALLPAFALATALGGVGLGVLGWRGSTTLTLILGGAERSYSVRGRDTLLLDFAEMVAERMMAASR